IVKDKPVIEPKMIVLHFTAQDSLETTFNYFDKTKIDQSRTAIKGQSALNVSAQFLVDRNGDVYRLMEDTKCARHVIGLNYMAIGVENVGSHKSPLTDVQ